MSYIALVTDNQIDNLLFQSAFESLIERSGGLKSAYGDWQITSVLTLKVKSVCVCVCLLRLLFVCVCVSIAVYLSVCFPVTVCLSV